MDNFGTISPFVPPEWIAAYGLRPAWLSLERQQAVLPEGAHRGLCPCAVALIVEAAAFYPDGAWWIPCIMEHNAHLLEIADSLGDAPRSQVAFVRAELERVREFLEGRVGQTLSEAALTAGIQRANRVRSLLLRLREVRSSRKG